MDENRTIYATEVSIIQIYYCRAIQEEITSFFLSFPAIKLRALVFSLSQKISHYEDPQQSSKWRARFRNSVAIAAQINNKYHLITYLTPNGNFFSTEAI